MASPKTFVQEFESPVAPARLFKAWVLESHILFPKLLSESVESVEILEGDATAVGSVTKLNFAKGHNYKYAKHKVDELDVEHFYFKQSTFEGDVLDGKYEYIVNETKFQAKGEDGSVVKFTSHFHPKHGVEISEKGIEFGLEKKKKNFKVIEEYLIANPELYA